MQDTISLTAICNAALRLINSQTINALDEDTEQARVCADIITPAIKGLLREAPWNFARLTRKLTLLDYEVQGWGYVYLLPADCLCAWQILLPEGHIPGLQEPRFEVANTNDTRVICTNVENAWLEYEASIIDVTKFDASFVEALEAKLASLLAMPLTGNVQMAQYYTQLAQALIQKAKGANAPEGRNHSLLDSRRLSSFEIARGSALGIGGRW